MTSVRQQLRRTSSAVRERPGSFERATPKVKVMQTDVRVLYALCNFFAFLDDAKLLILMVARDGIEPPTPAFSGPRSTN